MGGHRRCFRKTPSLYDHDGTQGRPLKFYINFDDLKLDHGSKATTLYWFPAAEELKFHEKYSLADSVEYTQIDGNWYIVEETYPWQ